MNWTPAELLICTLSRRLRDRETVVVGNFSPVPAAAALLAQASHAPRAEICILGDERNWPYEEAQQLYDAVQRGETDVFFLSGAQIDAYGNVNLHAIGRYESPEVRLPGGAGAALFYYRCKRILLFKTDHRPRGFPERVDFISAHAGPEYRQDGLGQLDGVYTPLSVMRRSPHTGRLRLAAAAPDTTVQDIRQRTGFELESEPEPERMEPPSREELQLLRGLVKDKMTGIYPRFAKEELGNG